MDSAEVLAFAPYITVIIVASVLGWVINTHNRIRNGYPLESSWGVAMHPKKDREAEERIKLLTSENAELRAQMSAMKERVETVERIVTDQSYGLVQEIEKLGIEKKASN